MSRRTSTIRFVISALLGFAPAAVFAVALNPQGPVAIPFLYVAALNGAFLVEYLLPRYRPIARAAVWLVTALGILLLVVNIVIIPHSAYLSWFRLLAEGRARGSVSYVFVMTAAFFGGLFSGVMYRRGVLLPALGLGLAVSILASIMFQSQDLFLLALAFVVVSLVVMRLRQVNTNVARSVVVFLALFALSAGFSWLFARNYEPGGSRMVDRHLSPYFRGVVVDAFPSFPIIYSIPGYGYSFESESPNFGNTPILSSNALFEVTAEPGTTVYLRTKVHEVFEDNRWKILEDSLNRATERRDLIAQRYFEAPAETGLDTERIEVELLGDFYAMLPHTLEMEAIRFQGESEPRFQYASMDTGFLLDSPMVFGDRVVITNRALSAGVEEDAEVPELSDRSRYLQTPPNLPQPIADLAEDLRGETLPDTVLALRDFLREEYEYTLETDTPPNDQDFTAWFLFESRTGYCVHFATAFVMLARNLGIPARYATGFLVNIPDISEEELFELDMEFGPQSVHVTGLSAHAWPEIWVPDLGWTIFEATPPMIPESYNDPLFAQLYGFTGNDLTGRQLSAILGNRLPEEEEQEAPSPFPLGTVLWIVGAAVMLTVSVLALAGYLKRRGHLEKGNRKRLQWILRRLVRRARRHGVRSPEDRGWIPWMEQVTRVADRSGNGFPDSEELEAVVDIIHRSFFGGYTPDSEDIQFARRLLNRIPRKTKHKQNVL
jgi:transglutaminase-like putative cysteine protease